MLDNANTNNDRASVLFLYAETPVHAGSGDVQAAIDLPIQRSVQTEWPILNDGTVRGGLRRLAAAWAGGDPEKGETVNHWFGTEEGSNPRPGAFATPDAEVVLFPVAAARGMTAWVTCPAAMEYLSRKLQIFGPRLSEKARGAVDELKTILNAGIAVQDGEARVSSNSAIEWRRSSPRKLILESDTYTILDASVDKLSAWIGQNVVPLTSYWRDRVKTHFALVSDAAFLHYVLRKTDIRTRIRVSAGRVSTGPWTEENLPVDTVLYTVLATTGDAARLAEFSNAMAFNSKPVIQLGGDQNLGRGMLRVGRLGD